MVKHLYSPLDIDSEVFPFLVSKLQDLGYRPLLLKMAQSVHSELGLSLNMSNYHQVLYDEDIAEGQFRHNTEVFIKGDDLFVIIYKETSFDDPFERSFLPAGFNLTWITQTSKIGQSDLEEFGDHIAEVVIASDFWYKVDGAEHPEKITWVVNELKSATPFERIDKLPGNFTTPEYQEEDVVASRLISDRKIREVLFLIKKAGAIRIEDVKNKFVNLTSQEIEQITKQLSSHGLLTDKYLIQCKKTSQSLAEIGTLADLEENAIQNLSCATCGRKYRDELIKEILSTTAKSDRLLKSSHWMTILVTARFIDGGINAQNIVWNVIDKSDEIDIAIDLNGSLYLLELKDQDFEVGHAYPLNYRRIKFDATKLVVITTGNVSKEAKALFEDLYNKNERYEMLFHSEATSPIVPIYIEGVDEIDESVAEIISNGTRIELDKVAHEIRMISEVNFAALFDRFVENMNA